MKTLRRCLLALFSIALACPAWADLTGVYVSQFSPSDPQYQQGGAQPIYLVVVERNGTAIGTVNATYNPPGSSLSAKVWSYASLPLSGGNTSMVDSFGVCNVSLAVSMQAYNAGAPDIITVKTTASAAKSGVDNPLGIGCLDLYPLITRDFHRVL